MFASGKAQPGSPWASSLEMVLETCFCPARLTTELSLPASLIRAGIRERSPGFPTVRRDTVLYQRLHLRFLHRLRICQANKSCNHPAGDSDMPLGWPLQTSLKNQSRNTFFNKKKIHHRNFRCAHNARPWLGNTPCSEEHVFLGPEVPVAAGSSARYHQAERNTFLASSLSPIPLA